MTETSAAGKVVAVARDDAHRFTKPTRSSITLIEGIGVDGDAHAGTTVQHRSRVRRDPTAPNLRQVHLIHAELFAEMARRGHRVEPGGLGENITTSGIDLLALPRGTRLALGEHAVVELTGLRNPCAQINGLSPGLMKELVHVDDTGTTVRLAGVMSIVVAGGVVHPGDPVRVTPPAGAHHPLEVV
ncbi:MOSC domain-containing protein [Microbacterium sp. MC2]